MDMILKSLEVMLMGMVGIFIVMGIICLVIMALNKIFKK